jgi:hypothetical protein
MGLPDRDGMRTNSDIDEKSTSVVSMLKAGPGENTSRSVFFYSIQIVGRDLKSMHLIDRPQDGPH